MGRYAEEAYMDRGGLFEGVIDDNYEVHALTKHVRRGTMRVDEAALLWRQTMRRPAVEDPLSQANSMMLASGSLDSAGLSMMSFGGGSSPTSAGPSRMTMTASASRFFAKQAEEIRVSRATEDLLMSFHRLCRPERAGPCWSAAHWALIAQVLGKLRGLSLAAGWAKHEGGQPLHSLESLEASADEFSQDAQAACTAEGETDSRVLRMACFLAQAQRLGPLRDLQGKLSEQVRSLSGIVLAQFRDCCTLVERMTNAQENREKLMGKLEESYIPFARNMLSMRQRLGDEMHSALEERQAPLQSAGCAASSLPLDRRRAVPERTAAIAPGMLAPQGGPSFVTAGDPFGVLHQNMLLSSISSLAEVKPGQGGGWGQTEEERRRERLVEEVLNGPESGSAVQQDTADVLAPAQVASWHVEFTSAQLRRMQRAARDRDTQVAGAQGLLRDTLERYEALAKAMAAAYGDEGVLRASPPEVGQHGALLGLVRELRELWRDAGAVLEPSRRADLQALEGVRMRHRHTVLNTFRQDGHEAAAVVLAKLALVDEMLEDPSERRFSKNVPHSLKKPYELVEGIVSSLGGAKGSGAAARQPHRRRRWLRCPHCTTRVVCAGEVWRQLMTRFLSAEAAFEPVSALVSEPLSLREFRILGALLELSMNERTSNIIYESAMDMTREISGAGMQEQEQATVAGLQELVLRYGERGSGDLGVAVKCALDMAWLGVSNKAQAAPTRDHSEEASGSRQQTQMRKAVKKRRVRRKSMFLRTQDPVSPGRSRSPSREGASSTSPTMVRVHSNASQVREPPQEPASPVSPGMSKKAFGAAIAKALGKIPSEDRGRGTAGGANRRTEPPMVCQRCLAGDVPNFPHASVGMLHRKLLDREGSKGPDESAKDGKESDEVPASLTQADLGDEETEQSFGEDMVLSWATTTLANSIILVQDERGAYFRWLARIVLYSGSSSDPGLDAAEGTALSSALKRAGAALTKQEQPQAGAGPAPGPAQPPLSREATLSPRQAAQQQQGSSQSPRLARSIRRASKGLGARGRAPSKSPLAIATALGMLAMNHTSSPSRAKEPKEDPAMPEIFLNAMRSDCGLPFNDGPKLGGEEEEDTAASRNASKEHNLSPAEPEGGVAARRRSLALHLHESLLDRFSKGGNTVAHRARRRARAAKLVVALRGLELPEHEVEAFVAEMKIVMETMAPSFNGVILVDGAARVARMILKPGAQLKKPSRPSLEYRPSSKDSRTQPPGTGSRASAALARRSAKDVVNIGTSCARQCYDQVGFGASMAHQRIAAALQFLEGQVFVPSGASRPAAKKASDSGSRRKGAKAQEMTLTMAPLLLPVDVARRWLDQSKREETASQAQGDADGTERRGEDAKAVSPKTASPKAASPKEASVSDGQPQDGAESQMTPKTETPKTETPTMETPKTGKGAPEQQAGGMLGHKAMSASAPELGAKKERRPRAITHLAHHAGDDGDADRDAAAPSAPRPRSFSNPQLVAALKGFGATGDTAAPIEEPSPFFYGGATEWHPEVRGLLDSVAARGKRVRSSARLRSSARGGFWLADGGRDGGVQLPALASPRRRGGGGAVVSRDRVLHDGWRVKMSSAIDSGERPKSRALHPQVEFRATGRSNLGTPADPPLREPVH